MNKIYIVFEGFYHEGENVKGVFSTEENALIYFNGLPLRTSYCYLEIREYNIDSVEKEYKTIHFKENNDQCQQRQCFDESGPIPDTKALLQEKYDNIPNHILHDQGKRVAYATYDDYPNRLETQKLINLGIYPKGWIK